MTFRTAVAADRDSILVLIDQTNSVDCVTLQGYRDNLADGCYRDEWMWVLEEHGEVRALAIWWGPPGHDYPSSVDGLYYAGDGDPAPAWTALIQHAVRSRPATAEPPEYHLFLDREWEDDPSVVADVERRSCAAAAAGLTAVTDRLRYEWRPAHGLPQRSSRLRFEPADDEAFADMLARVSQGSLDATTAREVARLGVVRAARDELEMYKSMPGNRGWWRLAYDGDGKLAGFVIPSANEAGPVVGYLGVVPGQRGRGYVDDLLAEVTHLLAHSGAERIRADTDVDNVPMVKSFERLHYRRFAIRRVLAFPQD